MNRWLNLAKLLAPIILAEVSPKLAPIMSDVTNGIAEAEQLGEAKGLDKLNHVQAIAKIAAHGVNTATNREAVNLDGLDAAVKDGVDTTVAVLNLITKK